MVLVVNVNPRCGRRGARVPVKTVEKRARMSFQRFISLRGRLTIRKDNSFVRLARRKKRFVPSRLKRADINSLATPPPLSFLSPADRERNKGQGGERETYGERNESKTGHSLYRANGVVEYGEKRRANLIHGTNGSVDLRLKLSRNPR